MKLTDTGSLTALFSFAAAVPVLLFPNSDLPGTVDIPTPSAFRLKLSPITQNSAPEIQTFASSGEDDQWVSVT
jgi:hypothetical protein